MRGSGGIENHKSWGGVRGVELKTINWGGVRGVGNGNYKLGWGEGIENHS